MAKKNRNDKGKDFKLNMYNHALRPTPPPPSYFIYKDVFVMSFQFLCRRGLIRGTILPLTFTQNIYV